MPNKKPKVAFPPDPPNEKPPGHNGRGGSYKAGVLGSDTENNISPENRKGLAAIIAAEVSRRPTGSKSYLWLMGLNYGGEHASRP